MSTFRKLSAELRRSRELLVPPAFQYLWTITRFLVAYGGRASAKSWSIARVLIVLAHEQPLRILCTREIQGSIKESAYRLLCDQIHMLGLSAEFDIQADSIIHKNGSRFFFEGLRYNSSKIRSYESIDICWVEEAQSVSELSWETLLPTIRKPGSRLFISFNPLSADDPVTRRFVDATPPGCIAKKVSFRDNPHFSAESEAERAWLEQTDPDGYQHVWEGFPRTQSDAQILKGKFVVERVSTLIRDGRVRSMGSISGFAKDPSAAVRCHIDDRRARSTSAASSGAWAATSTHCPQRSRNRYRRSAGTWSTLIPADRRLSVTSRVTASRAQRPHKSGRAASTTA